MSLSQGEAKRTGESGEVFLQPPSRPPTPTSRKRTQSSMNLTLGAGISSEKEVSPPFGARGPIPVPDPVDLGIGPNPLAIASAAMKDKRSLAEKALNLVRFSEELREAQEITERDLRLIEASSPELKAMIQGARSYFQRRRKIAKTQFLSPEELQTKKPKVSESSSSSSSSQDLSNPEKISKSRKKREKEKRKKKEASTSKENVEAPPNFAVRTEDLDPEIS